MAAQWLMTDQELETKDSETDQEELFVFGYACKVFRDDEKAQYIDEGRHLIPWMGDDRLLIDRYDGRGHLYDLSQYDVSNVKAEHKVLSEEEKQIEALCDEERYLELHTDVAEKKMYEEEEWKRYYETLSEGYNAVGFSYDYQHQLEYEQSASAMIEEKPFVIPEEIQVPVGMIAPTTEKHHAIIEKTAKFIASHGIQMEIIIKTKQKDNSQFDFMHFDDEMNPYYKHLLQMIKSGKYKPKVEEKPTEEEDHDNEDHSHHHGYLHPSLMPRRVSPTPEVGVTVPMPKVSVHDTPYGQLIKSLKKTDEKHAEKSSKNSQKKTGEQHTEKGPPPPPPIPSYMSESVYGPTHSGMPLPPGIEPVTLPSSNQPPPPGTDLAGPVLPRYRHRSEEEDDDELEASTRNIRPEGIVPPPPDVQPVIDRMAMYVAKNGEEFEIVVKSKRDTRFDFLHSWHTHFPYYNFKKNLELTEIQRLKKQADLEKPKGVSFSIKNKVKDQDTMALEKRQVFDNESSEDEKEGDIDGYRLTRSDVSGTATPIDGMFSTEYRNENKTEKITASSDRRLAEERLKDKLAVAAREKLAQASKEKQMKAERKRKVAMFVNMLKSTNQQAPGQSGDDYKDEQDLGPDISGTPLGSRSHTPINWDESTKDSTNGDMFSRSSKRSRDRSRSTTPRQFRRSPSPLQFSRSKRSRSRSPRRRRRSPTPPSAYSRMRRTLSRSPVRWGVPRPASPIRRRDRSRSPRYSRTRSRSPSVTNSRRRDRSRSPRSSRNKSPISSTRKRSRSRSPSRSKSTKKDRKSSPSSLLSSRSSKKSKKKKKSRSKSPSSRSKSSKKTNPSSPAEVVIINDDSPEINPAADTQVANEPLEEGEIDSRLSPVVEESSSLSTRIPQLSDLQKSETEVIGRSSTPSNIEDHSNSSVTMDTGTESKPPEIQKNVSNYMLSRVRAIIKASRQAVLEEDGPLDDL